MPTARRLDMGTASARLGPPVGESLAGLLGKPKRKRRLAPLPPPLIEPGVRFGTGFVELDVPLHLVNRGNANGNRWERVKANKRAAGLIGDLLCTVPPVVRNTLAGPVRVLVVRVGPRGLDKHDNLRHALKGVVDCLAVWLRHGRLGQRDGDADLDWKYGQDRDGDKYGVKIRFEVTGGIQT